MFTLKSGHCARNSSLNFEVLKDYSIIPLYRLLPMRSLIGAHVIPFPLSIIPFAFISFDHRLSAFCTQHVDLTNAERYEGRGVAYKPSFSSTFVSLMRM